MVAQKELEALVALARTRGAVIETTNDVVAEIDEGRSIYETIRVSNGWQRIGPHPMSPIYAAEKLREVLN